MCLVSLKCDATAPLFAAGKVKVSPLAMVMETGHSCENEGILLEGIRQDTDFDKHLQGRHINEEIMDWSHFYDDGAPNPVWWAPAYRNDVAARADAFKEMLKYRDKDWSEKPAEGECIVVFNHWDFVKALTGKDDMKNFGAHSYNDESKLHRKSIREKLEPGAPTEDKWSWWRESGEYDAKLV